MPVPGGGIELVSHAIQEKLNIPISVLMGANLAPEVADEKFCETTIGAASQEEGNVLREIIQTHYFRVVVVNDVEAVEMCGALKVTHCYERRSWLISKIQILSFRTSWLVVPDSLMVWATVTTRRQRSFVWV